MSANGPDPLDPLTPDERVVDEVLGDDAPSGLAAEVRPVLSPRARRRVALQQAMHGLLRSLHSADAAARETRIDRVMAGVVRAGHGGVRSILRRGRWRLLAAAAILVVGAVALFTWAPVQTYFESEAFAVVARAADHLETAVDREFQGRLTMESASGEAGFQGVQGVQFRLFAGGKGRFVAEIQSMGGFRLPVRLWLNRDKRWMQFGNERRREITGKPLPLPFGELDLSMLELDQILRNLPSSFEIKSWGRLKPASAGEAGQVQITAVPRQDATVPRPGSDSRPGGRRLPLQQVELIADEATGILRRVEILADNPKRGRREERGSRVRLVIEHVGTPTLPPDFYDGEPR